MQHQPLRELSLFTGAGGGILGSMLLGHHIVGAVEQNEYCCRVLEQRQRDGILERFPIFQTDIRDFIREGYAELYKGHCDIVSGGFPCQPFSVAGKQLGAADPRNMWPATIAVIRAVRPRFAFLENVPAILSSGYFGTILGDLAESGYDCRWRILSAAEMGAPHLRNRVWIVAYTQDNGQSLHNRESNDKRQKQTGTGEWRGLQPEPSESCANTARQGSATHSASAGCKTEWDTPAQQTENVGFGTQTTDTTQQFSNGRCHNSGVSLERESVSQLGNDNRKKFSPWGENAGSIESLRNRTDVPKPLICGMDDGMAYRVDRLKAIGNGQVPAVVAAAWQLLTSDLA